MLFTKIKEYSSDDSTWIISRILMEIDKSEPGFNNLKKTYINDPHMIAVYENVSLKFKQLIHLLK